MPSLQNCWVTRSFPPDRLLGILLYPRMNKKGSRGTVKRNAITASCCAAMMEYFLWAFFLFTSLINSIHKRYRTFCITEDTQQTTDAVASFVDVNQSTCGLFYVSILTSLAKMTQEVYRTKRGIFSSFSLSIRLFDDSEGSFLCESSKAKCRFITTPPLPHYLGIANSNSLMGTFGKMFSRKNWTTSLWFWFLGSLKRSFLWPNNLVSHLWCILEH